jgi:hypothetical protein
MQPMIVSMARFGPRALRAMADRYLQTYDLVDVDVLSPGAAMRAAGFVLRSSSAPHLAGMTLSGERVAYLARGGNAVARLGASRHELGHVVQFADGVVVADQCEPSCERLGLIVCLPPRVFEEALTEAGPDVRALREWYRQRADVDVAEEDLAHRIALQIGGYALERTKSGALRVLWSDVANDLPLEKQFKLSQLGSAAWQTEEPQNSDGSTAIPYRDRNQRLRVVVVGSRAA